jgi:2-polyprenyl-3-methyl-5-hydroxy-6-metoxy-1,4-benzoquinol methylase
MTQQDIRQFYEQEWRSKGEGATSESDLRYSGRAEDLVYYPIFRQFIADIGGRINGGRLLDVGCGSGRWVRFFLESFKPAHFVGVDVTESSVALLKQWYGERGGTAMEFRTADVTDPNADLGGPYDFVNIANVLFHIPEQDLFLGALANLAKCVKPTGRIVTTEYLPRVNMRTEWMLVRSRYEFEAAVKSVGLRIVDIRATGFFANDPMGLDGPDDAARGLFHQVRSGQRSLLGGSPDPQTQAFLVNHLADIERAMLAYCRERIADIDLPSQKLVALARG